MLAVGTVQWKKTKQLTAISTCRDRIIQSRQEYYLDTKKTKRVVYYTKLVELL